MNPEDAVGAGVLLTCDQLTDDEFVTMNLCAQLGTDPRKCLGWNKGQYLFTARSAEGIPVAHEMVKDALATIVMMRFPNAGE